MDAGEEGVLARLKAVRKLGLDTPAKYWILASAALPSLEVLPASETQPQIEETPAMPERLFKYVSHSIICDLLQGTIRFSQPDALNDPFEMHRFREQNIEEATPAMIVAPTQATLDIMGQLTAHPTESPLETSTRARDSLLRSSIDFIGGPAADIMRRLSPLGDAPDNSPSADEIARLKQQAKEITATMNGYGILSLTRHDDDLLMWAHYADEHRGAVFEIDIADEAFCANFVSKADSSENINEWRRDVAYPPERANPPTGQEELIVSFFQKSPQWKSEHEYRIIRLLKEGKPLKGKQDRGGHEIVVFPLPPSSIRSVTFGARNAEPEATDRDAIVRTIRSRPELRHVALREAHLSLNTYGLEIRPLAPDAEQKDSRA